LGESDQQSERRKLKRDRKKDEQMSYSWNDINRTGFTGDPRRPTSVTDYSWHLETFYEMKVCLFAYSMTSL
jgi:hypothetical protein